MSGLSAFFSCMRRGLCRKAAYAAAALTGFCSLCGQVAWQKYLTVLVGSEARSTTLVVAVFLFGLSLGYYSFGRLTEKRPWTKRPWTRRALLKLYGYAEIATAIYFGVFCFYFSALKPLSFALPPVLILDILIALLALLPPSFLMGASIPMLTATLTETSEEASGVHARVYGWNALGACLGCLAAGFYFLPAFGLGLTLAIAAVINFLAALVFIGNRLKGDVQKPAPPPPVESAAPAKFYFVFAFLTGAALISLEVLSVRVLSLSWGAGVYNFSMTVSLFIGGLAWGSLSINKSAISAAYLIRQLLWAVFFGIIIFGAAPYWSIWISHIRVSLSSIPSNYFVFKALVFVFLALFLLPAAFFMGRFLPLVYALLKKGSGDYGAVCGRLYFLNALGNVFGAIAGGYLALYFLDLDQLLKIIVYVLIFLALALALYEKRSLSLTALAALSLAFLALPSRWDRSGHYIGYFQLKSPHSDMRLKKLFFLPSRAQGLDTEIGYFKDGPSATVTLLNHRKAPEAAAGGAPKRAARGFGQKPAPLSGRPPLSLQSGAGGSEPFLPGGESENSAGAPGIPASSYSIIINGKSDGNTMGDFSTMFLSSSLPYLFLPKAPESGFSAAVIGLGTGVSAGALGKLKDIRSVSVLEISSEVIKAIKEAAPEFNFFAMRNPKIKILRTDAFRHFAKISSKGLTGGLSGFFGRSSPPPQKFDLIVSEPTNPWTAGVENLFAPEFYKLASRAMTDQGIFAQWIQTYDIDRGAVLMILGALKKSFPHAALYRIGHRDLAAIASRSPLRPGFSEKRFSEKFLRERHKSIGFFKMEDIHLMRIYDEGQLSRLISYPEPPAHTLSHPRLSFQADKAFFMGRDVEPFHLAPEFFPAVRDSSRIKAFKKYMARPFSRDGKKCSRRFDGFNFLPCYLEAAARQYRIYTAERRVNPEAGRLQGGPAQDPDSQKAGGADSRSLRIQKRYLSYLFLADHGLIHANERFLDAFFQKMTKDRALLRRFLISYISQRLRAWPGGPAPAKTALEKAGAEGAGLSAPLLDPLQLRRVKKDLDFLKKESLIGESLLRRAERHIEQIKTAYKKWEQAML